ncbi:MAG: hypothetical protein WDM91_11285 [Rhizomicrobium sp.]
MAPAEQVLGPWLKGMASHGPWPTTQTIGAQNWNLLNGDLTLPCAVLKSSALAANSSAMRRFLELTGAELWPHGKTTMSPELMARQLEDGAAGMTAATVQQMEAMLLHGQRRILIANQVVGPAELRLLSGALNRYPELELMVLVDSVESVQLLQRGLSFVPDRRLGVLVEMGQVGARTGVRSVAEGLRVAAAVMDSAKLRLRGVETYEGIVPGADQLEIEKAITMLFGQTVELAEAMSVRGYFREEPIILSGGGSCYYDMAALSLHRAKTGDATRILVRSGCYLTHDDGWLAGFHERMRHRSPELTQGEPVPRPALEVWAHLQSRPEPTRGYATLGKRDASYDIDLPKPLRWFRRDLHSEPQALPENHTVIALNDQHAHLEFPASSPLQVGDLLCFGISHPCTTFDKWRAIPIVDDRYNVVSVVTTWF